MNFRNNISLCFWDNNLEENFKIKQDSIIRKNNSFLNLITFFICISQLTTHLIIKSSFEFENSFYQRLSLYLNAILAFLSFICCLLTLCLKNKKFHKIITFLNYIGITIPFFLLREDLNLINADYNYYLILLIFEAIIRKLWLTPLMMVFLEILFIHLVLILGILVVGPFCIGSFAFKNFNLPYCSLLLYLTLASYFGTKQSKLNFLNNFKIENKNKLNNEILENMNTGFIKFKGNKINFINEKLMDVLKTNHEIQSLIQNEQVRKTIKKDHKLNKITYKLMDLVPFESNVKESNMINNKETIYKIINFLFLNSASKDDNFQDDEIKNLSDQNKAVFLMSYITKKLIHSELHKLKKIKFLFNANVDFYGTDGEKEILTYEVFGRIYEENNIEMSEFIFKDVTRTKHIEQLNAEFKLKSLFLSKISHELKNPLICCNEIINQIIDSFTINNYFDPDSIEKNLKLINSLSNYLLIIVKDIEFFSMTQNNYLSDVEFSQTCTKSIIDFCTNISKGLISKNKKDVNFIVEVDSNLPLKIYTDETKLKQILINIQSNSIKFTNKGYVKFSIFSEEDFIKFTISDSGQGMNEETKKKLFSPFNKSLEDNNKLGSGLGLSICLDLLKLLGGVLDYQSEIGKGTTFNIKIPNKQNSSKFSLEKNCNLKVPKVEIKILENSEMKYKSEKIEKNSNFFDSENLDMSKSDVSSFSRSLNNSILTTKNDCVGNKLKNELYENLVSNRKNSNISSKIEFNEDEKLHEEIGFKYNCGEKENETISIITKKVLYTNKNDISFSNVNYAFKTNSSTHQLIENYQIQAHYSWNIKDELNPISQSIVYIVADDEYLTRQSSIRILKYTANKMNKKICIFESSDGAETLWLMYRFYQISIKVSAIITDQNMNFIKGNNFAYITRNLLEFNSNINIYLVSAFEQRNLFKFDNCFTNVYSKPLNAKSSEFIINES